jgi:hypothetical protein
MDNELEFLRYFYERARDGMGPADSEIYDMIKQDYVDKYGVPLPIGYEFTYSEEEQ